MKSNFYPDKLKDTYAETVGKFYRLSRWVTSIAILVTGVLYVYVSHTSAIITLAAAYFVREMLIGREFFIDSTHKIRTATDLRMRLLVHRDIEFALESLAKDSVWRGDPIDTEITEQLAKIRKEREEVKDKLSTFLEELAKSVFDSQNPEPTPKKDGGPN